jgi:hypothetical protein
MRFNLNSNGREQRRVNRVWSILLWTIVAATVISMVCSAKVMAADQVAAKAKTDSSLNDPSEKDGEVVVGETGSPQNLSLPEQVLALQKSLALAKAEAEFYSQQYKELRLRNEMMGVDALTADEQHLQDHVVQLVKELYQTEKDRRELVNRLQQIIDASQEILKTADKVDPQKRADYEVALRSARDVLAGKGRSPIPVAVDLHSGQVISMNPELNSVIVNLGYRLDVKTGMPLRALRGDHMIAKLRVFQVREQISAALVEAVAKNEQLKVGDRVEIDVQ